MRTKLLHDHDGLRTFAVVLELGDEVMTCLTDFARSEGITGAQITAIGAFSRAVVTFFDWETKAYEDIPVHEQVEVASLNGDIGVDEDDAQALHVHLVLGRRDGSAVAGHLKEGHVRPTLEIIVTETPRHLRRCKDETSGLHLIRI